MNRFITLACLVSILANSAWIDRGDPGRSGSFNDSVSPRYFESPRHTRKLLPMEGNDQVTVESNPAVSDGTIVIASKEGRIYALSTGDLSLKWSNDLKILGSSAAFAASPAIDEGKIYVPYYWINPEPSPASKPIAGICCYNLEDGRLEWRTGDLRLPVESTPLVDGNKIIFGCNDRKVYAIDKANKGNPVPGWNSIELTGQVKAGVAKLGDGRYIVACQGQPHSESEYTKNLYCLNPSDGSISWGPLQTKGSIDYTPATWGRYIFVTTYGYIIGSETDARGMLYCFDRERNPNELWSVQFNGRMTGSPATNGKYVVAADIGQYLRIFKLEGDSYSEQATYMTDNIIMNSPVIAGNHVYAGARNGYLYIYDMEQKYIDGLEQPPKEVQKLNVGANEAYLRASPVFWNEALFAVNSIGHVFKFEMMPNISVKFDTTELTVRKGETFRFKATIKNERGARLAKPVKVTLRTEADWLTAETDASVSIVEAGQQAVVDFSGVADKATSQPLTAVMIISSDVSELRFPHVVLKLNVTEKNLQVTYTGKNQTIWDDELTQSMKVTNTGNTQILFDIITDIGVSLLSNSRSILLDPDATYSISFAIDPKACGYDRPVDLRFSFRSDGEDLAKYTLSCTLKRTYKVIRLTIGKETAIIDDSTIKIQPAPYISKGVTMVPLRFISEGLGLVIEWVADIKTIIIDMKNDSYLRLLIGSPKAYLDMPDGSIKEILLSAPPQITKGKTFVPLRIISELFSCEVAWNGLAKSVTITKRMKP